MGWFEEFIETAQQFVGGVTETIRETANTVIEKAQGVVANVAGNVGRFIEPVIQTAQQTVAYIEEKVAGPVNAAVTAAAEKTAEIANEVRQAVEEKARTIIAEAEEAAEPVRKAIEETAEKLKATASGGGSKVVETVTNTIETIKESVGDIIVKIPDVFSLAFEAFNTALPETLSPISTALQTAGESAVSIGESLSPFKMLSSLSNLFELISKANTLLQSVGEFTSSPELNQAVKDNIPLMSDLGALVGNPMGFLPVLGDSYSAGIGQLFQNQARVNYLPSRLPIETIALATKRGIPLPDSQRNAVKELGWSNDTFQLIEQLTRQMLAAQDFLVLWLRKEITDEELTAKLRELTISDIDIDSLKKLTEIIPGVNDLIRMAVREAFTPEIAEKFGQYQDFPEDLVEWAGKQGLSRDWAERYWASHWELPGANMGFEMFHRKIIDRDELVMLLRALDVMPFWRDKLIQLAYQPITRVDIRRFHKIGVLEDSELPERYEAIGYSPDDAKLQTRFTIELNKEEAKFEKQAERDLSASEVLAAYQSRTISQTETVSMLTTLGYDENEVTLKMSLADLADIKRIRGKEIDIIKNRLYYNKIDINTAIDQLNKLDLPPYEMSYQLLDIQLDLELAAAKKEAKSGK